MSEYRIRSTGEVKTQGQIRSDHPEVSLPKVWGTSVHNLLGIDPVLPSPRPEPTGEYKVVLRNGTRQDDNFNWVWDWAEHDMFQEYTETDEDGVETTVTVQDQIDAKVAADNAGLASAARSQRDELLKATDHFGLSDVTMSDEMTAYRQSLRDVPQQADFPATITWPTKPE